MLETFIIFALIGGLLGAGADLWKQRRKPKLTPLRLQVAGIFFLLWFLGHGG